MGDNSSELRTATGRERGPRLLHSPWEQLHDRRGITWYRNHDTNESSCYEPYIFWRQIGPTTVEDFEVLHRAGLVKFEVRHFRLQTSAPVSSSMGPQLYSTRPAAAQELRTRAYLTQTLPTHPAPTPLSSSQTAAPDRACHQGAVGPTPAKHDSKIFTLCDQKSNLFVLAKGYDDDGLVTLDRKHFVKEPRQELDNKADSKVDEAFDLHFMSGALPAGTASPTEGIVLVVDVSRREDYLALLEYDPKTREPMIESCGPTLLFDGSDRYRARSTREAETASDARITAMLQIEEDELEKEVKADSF